MPSRDPKPTAICVTCHRPGYIVTGPCMRKIDGRPCESQMVEHHAWEPCKVAMAIQTLIYLAKAAMAMGGGRRLNGGRAGFEPAPSRSLDRSSIR
jgi:hypothetical protein